MKKRPIIGQSKNISVIGEGHRLWGSAIVYIMIKCGCYSKILKGHCRGEGQISLIIFANILSLSEKTKSVFSEQIEQKLVRFA